MNTQVNHETVDSVFEKFTKPGSPGCALAVMQDGQIVYRQGYGLAHLEYDIPITPSTIFHVASLSKQFTAFAVALLASASQLGFDDDIRKHLPQVPDFGATITIRHLIHHTSGLRDQWVLLLLAGWTIDDVITTGHVMKLVQRQRELNFTPGAEYSYCNTGYTLLAQIVEQISGQSFAAFCQEKIFQPLGMANTHFHDSHQTLVKNRAYSYYRENDGSYLNAVLSYATVGATSLFTTAEDLLRWEENFYSGKVGGMSVIEQMHQRGVLNDSTEIAYAFGLVIDQYRGQRTVDHSGGDAGFRSHLLRFPDHHLSIAILGNMDKLEPGKLARKVADVVLRDQLDDEVAVEPIALDHSQLRAYAGTYFNADKAILRDAELKDGQFQVMGQAVFALSENQFVFPDNLKATVRFHPDQLAISDGPFTTTFTRTAYTREAHPLTPDHLRAYTGRYHSAELAATWTIALADDHLVVQQTKHPDTPLQPIFPDGFINNWQPVVKDDYEFMVVFERDANQAISGFRISDDRTRKVHFVKITPASEAL